MKEQLERLAKATGVSEETILAAAQGCASRAVEWCESEEKAIFELNASPVGMVEILLHDYLESMRKLAVRAHMHPTAFSEEVIALIKQREAA